MPVQPEFEEMLSQWEEYKLDRANEWQLPYKVSRLEVALIRENARFGYLIREREEGTFIKLQPKED